MCVCVPMCVIACMNTYVFSYEYKAMIHEVVYTCVAALYALVNPLPCRSSTRHHCSENQ